MVYEGRGWSKQPEGKQQFPDVASKIVDIAFIGDYTSKYNKSACNQFKTLR